MKHIYSPLCVLFIFGFFSIQVRFNQVFGQQVNVPVCSADPGTGDFSGVQLGAERTIHFTITNPGVSVLKVKKIEITGDHFTLTDTNEYPFEVEAENGFAFPVGNHGKTLSFSVTFSPESTGVQTGKVLVTYGLYTEAIHEIPLTGEGLSCSEALVAKVGENWSPRQNVWIKYTADKFSIVQISSCHPHQPEVGADQWPLDMFPYYDCSGTQMPYVEYADNHCTNNSTAVYYDLVMDKGETIYMFWPVVTNSLHASEGFYYNIVVTYPVDGDVCENAVPLTLPVVNLFGTTTGYYDDYNYSPCSSFMNYMDGNDKVYTITLPEDGYLTGNILGAFGSIHVLDVCPTAELDESHCKAWVGGPNGGQFTRKIDAGTYFVIVSNCPPPQNFDFLLNMSWVSVDAVENDDLTSNLSVYPNPAHDQFTISISNNEVTGLTLELVNLSGQIVYRNQVKAVYSFNGDIDVSRFAKGVYYLKVNTGKELNIKKVVVE